MKSVQLHHIEMKQVEKQLTPSEKEIVETVQSEDTDTDQMKVTQMDLVMKPRVNMADLKKTTTNLTHY